MAGVFITGASSGIGEALARHYARAGATLGLAARRTEILQALAGTLPGTHAAYALDVVDRAAMAAAATDFCARYGAPDIVIANAGLSSGTHGDTPDDLTVLERLLAVNVTGLASTLAAFAPAMRAANASALSS